MRGFDSSGKSDSSLEQTLELLEANFDIGLLMLTPVAVVVVLSLVTGRTLKPAGHL